MKKKFKIEGLCCPVCAGKIESKVAEFEGVTSSKLNFMAEKLTVECDDAVADSLLAKIKEAAATIEPDAVVSEA